jgi:DNA-binding GntR family transcriptional regulator
VSQEAKKKRGRPRTLRLDGAVGNPLRLSRVNICERAVARLRSLIVHGEFAPETALVEAELCAMLGISRTPLREALKLLAAQGLVELRQNRSARVASMKSEEIADLFQALSGIERVTGELAAERMVAADLARLHAMQHEMERHYAVGELHGYFALNQAIHGAIVASARNTTLRETHEWLLARAERARYVALASRRRWDESVDEHRAILTAFDARDSQAAGRLLGTHVLNTGREVIKALNQVNKASARDAAAWERRPACVYSS